MSQPVADNGFSQKKVEIPEVIHALLKDMAIIRNVILLNAPSCLPQVAPAFIDAEERINGLLRP